MASPAGEDPVHRADHGAASAASGLHQQQQQQSQQHQAPPPVHKHPPIPIHYSNIPSSQSQPPSNLVPASQHAAPLMQSQAQASMMAGMGLSLLTSTPSFSSPPDSNSPSTPVYTPASIEPSLSGVNHMQSFSQPSAGGQGGSAQGQHVPPNLVRQLSMDVDHAYAAPSHSAPPSTPAGQLPGTSFARPGSYYPPQAASTSAHPAVQRHHPYAHPTHTRPMPPLPHSQSTPAVPLYHFANTPSSGAQTPTDSPPLATPLTSPTTSTPPHSLVYPSAPPGPHRVHSAPTHLLSHVSPAPRQDGSKLSLGDISALDDGMDEGGYGGGQPEWEARPVLPARRMTGQSAGSNGGPIPGGSVPRDWDGDRAMLVDAQVANGHSTPAQDDQAGQNGYFDGTPPQNFAYYQQPGPAPGQILSPTGQLPPQHSTMIQLDSPVQAIALVRNRLPILEAALSASANDLGNDEEEIWKGVEGAYEELKRIMFGRRDARRAAAGKPPKRSFASMDMEAPPAPGPPPQQFQHPPISQSTIDANLSLARAQAQLDASHAQLQQAQQAQAEARARADAEARARAEADQRARAEEEARLQQEAIARADADAEDSRQRAETAQREHEAQYREAQANHSFQLAQQEQQFRLAQQQVHQQQIALAQADAAAAQAHAQAIAQHQSQYTSAPQYSLPPTQQYPPATAGSLPPGHSAHIPHTPSPLSSIIPAHSAVTPTLASSQLPPVSRAQQPAGLVSSAGQTFAGAYDPGYDAGVSSSMGAVMQMHMGSYPGMDSMDHMDHSSTVAPDQMDGTRQQWSNVNYAALAAAASGVVDPAATTTSAAPVASPPSSVVSGLQSRPSRSRAASGSGYISASGSRSRAASGSGYQSLLESRSRAASSASSVFGTFERDDDDELDDDHDHEDGGLHKTSSQMGAASAGVDPALRAAIDPIFIEFLAELCSNLDATDSKGEPIHQTLMAKKMERLDQSHDFRPFKFRIQAFTSAFSEMLALRGYAEADVPFKKIRQYLWAQPCISRFNDDGKKAKSKGNHIWSIEAKKVPDKKWIFREFTRCIKGSPPSVAFAGLPWSWSPRVWDPQCSVAAIGASFSSPALPSWLSWDDNVLSGEAPDSLTGTSLEIKAIATFQTAGKVQQLEATCTILIASVGDHPPDDRSQDEKPDLSEEHSNATSPSPPSHASSATLLPSLMDESATASMRGAAIRAKQEEMAEDDLLVRQHHIQMQVQAEAEAQAQAQAQAQQFAMFQQPEYSADSQAALHHHYASLSAAQPAFHHSAAQLSYTPAPELVADALQRAAYERSLNPSFSSPMAMDHTLQHLGSQQGDAGTPSGLALSDVHMRLSSFALSSQPPMTLDPSNM
ncbi:hypothetical protein RQP46_000815 [Phenoliferia psychrophenolica]